MPFYYFPAIMQQTMWGTIGGNIRLQSDLVEMVHHLLLSEFVLVVDFSKYGEISAGEYFFPHRIFFANGQKAEIVSYESGLLVGNAVLLVKQNGNTVQQLSAIEANSNIMAVNLDESIELTQKDILSVFVTQSENARNLLFRLIIRVSKSDEI